MSAEAGAPSVGWRRTAELVRPYLPQLVLAAALAGVIAGCRGALVWLVRDVLDGLLAAGDGRARWLLPAAIVALFTVQGTARAWRTWLTRTAAISAEASLRQRLFTHLLHRAPARLAADGVGDRLSRLSHDAGKVRTAMGAAVTVVQRPLSALALLIAAAVMSPSLFGWSLLGLPMVAAVVVWTGRRTRRSSLDHAESLGRLEALARDALLGLRSVQAHGAEPALARAYEDANGAQVQAALRTTGFRVVGPPLVELAGAVSVAVVIALGAGQVARGELTAGALVAFLVALGLLNEPLKGFTVAHGLWSDARGALGRVFEELDVETVALDAGEPFAAETVVLELRGVTVDRGRGPIVQDLDLRLVPGKIVALCGANGAGKSTLIDAIAGFCPHDGVIAWNGVDGAALTLSSRRDHLALVDQEPWLGSGTLLDAVRLGRPDVPRRVAEDALCRVGLLEPGRLVAGLDAGLDAAVGDAGAGVSGGERQRIALARALVRRAPLLLLDEPTAHLDPDAERAFLGLLRALRQDHTILLVTHRDAPRAVADRAYELVDGALRTLPVTQAEAS